MPSLLAAAVATLTLAAGPTTLKGGGVEVTLDLGAFAQDLGAGPLHDAYYRLGQFSLPEKARARTGGKPLVMSVLVDEVPPNVDLDRLRAHVLQTTPEPKPEVTAISAPAGFWLSYRQDFPQQGFTQWHLYFHTLHEGKWVELHFSSLGRSPNTNTAALEKLALEVVRSVRVARKRTKA